MGRKNHSLVISQYESIDKGGDIMVHVMVHHKVKDYAQWKEVFEENAKARKEGRRK